MYLLKNPSVFTKKQVFSPIDNVARGKVKTSQYHLTLKLGVWAYFLLLIFEGALRKWIFPGLATPLLIIRDPIALWLVISTLHRGVLKFNSFLVGMVAIGFIGINTAILFGHGSLLVALYGARPLLIHFPLIFVIGHVFFKDDVIKIGKVLLWISIPMTVLIASQFYSPQSAFVNRGVGGDIGGAGFSGALNFFRPPGTFSFTNGNTLFYAFVAAYVLYFWLNPKHINKVLLIASTAALLIAIPLSISRGLFFQVGISFIFAIIAASKNPKYLNKIVFVVVAIFVALAILSTNSYFQTATKAFTSRFETASTQEGGLQGTLGHRYIGGLVGDILSSSNQTFFGFGLGMGTNVGSMLLSGKTQYLISEGEWGRLLGELGPLLGLLVIFIRVGLSIKISIASWQRLSLGDILPWMLLSFGFLNILQAQWSQPTSLGFTTLIAGLLLASLKPGYDLQTVQS